MPEGPQLPQAAGPLLCSTAVSLTGARGTPGHRVALAAVPGDPLAPGPRREHVGALLVVEAGGVGRAAGAAVAGVELKCRGATGRAAVAHAVTATYTP